MINLKNGVISPNQIIESVDNEPLNLDYIGNL